MEDDLSVGCPFKPCIMHDIGACHTRARLRSLGSAGLLGASPPMAMRREGQSQHLQQVRRGGVVVWLVWGVLRVLGW